MASPESPRETRQRLLAIAGIWDNQNCQNDSDESPSDSRRLSRLADHRQPGYTRHKWPEAVLTEHLTAVYVHHLAGHLKGFV